MQFSEIFRKEILRKICVNLAVMRQQADNAADTKKRKIDKRQTI